MEVSKNQGYFFLGGKDCSILVSILGSPYLGNYQMWFRA